MSTVLEKARGAAAYSIEDRDVPLSVERSATLFVRPLSDFEWDTRIEELKAFRSLEDDWDGDGSVSPGPELTDCAIGVARSLQKQNFEPPDRVVVGVNGTIYFEWHGPLGYYEIEVYSPTSAEGRWVPNDSNKMDVSTSRRGT